MEVTFPQCCELFYPDPFFLSASVHALDLKHHDYVLVLSVNIIECLNGSFLALNHTEGGVHGGRREPNKAWSWARLVVQVHLCSPLRSHVQMQPVPMPEEYDESGTKGMSSTSGDTKVGSVLNGRFVTSPLIA